jgi:hypothetical protein
VLRLDHNAAVPRPGGAREPLRSTAESGIFAAVRSLAEPLNGWAEQPGADDEHQTFELVFAQIVVQDLHVGIWTIV